MTLVRALGWTLVHSTWEIAIIGGILFSANLLLRRSGASIRYGVALLALAASILIPLATCYSLATGPQEAPAIATTAPASSFRTSLKSAAPSVKYPAPQVLGRVLAPTESAQLERAIEPYLPNLVVLWLAGLFIMSLRLVGGVFAIERLKGRASAEIDPTWIALADSVARRLGIHGQIALRTSNDIDSPSVVGILKSVILVPACLVTKLSPEQIEAVLAHELAHVKRYDYPVNLIQSVVESVLFYHPAAWWICARVRAEREHCCDDLAIQVVGDRTTYAHALLGLEELRLSPRLAMGAHGGSLLDRVRRILLSPQRAPARSSASLAMVLVLAIAFGLMRTLEARSDDPNTVRGTVVTAAGRPAGGAQLYTRLINLKTRRLLPPTPPTLTGSDGSFQLELPPGTDCFLCAYLPGEGIGTIAPKQGKTLLMKLVSGENLPLRAVDMKGAPIAGVRLEPYMIAVDNIGFPIPPALADELSGVTDSQGRTALPDIPNGAFLQYKTQSDRFAVAKVDGPRHSSRVKVAMTTITLSPSCVVEGVVDFHGRPQAGAMVFARSSTYISTGETDENGRFRLAQVAEGKSTISAYAPDTVALGLAYLDRAETKWIAPLVTVSLSPDAPQTVNIHAEQGATVSGTVVDPQGKPLSTGMVSVLKSIDPMYTLQDAQIRKDGTFAVRLLPGKYWLIESDSTLMSRLRTGGSVPVTLKNGDVKTVRLRAPDGLVDLECLALDEFGQPISGAQIVAYDQGRRWGDQLGEVLSDAKGLGHVAVPEHSLKTLYVIGFKGNLFSPTHVRPVNGRVVLRLSPVALSSVHGTVTDLSGNPLSGAKVSLGFDGLGEFLGDLQRMGPWSQKTGPDGKFSFGYLYPSSNPFVMIARDGFGDVQTQKIAMNPGQQVTLPLIRLKPASFVAGRVLDQHGNPVVGAQVSVRAFQVSDFFAHTDRDGKFRLDRIVPGNYWIDISKGYSEAHQHALVGKDSTYTIKLAPGNKRSSSY